MNYDEKVWVPDLEKGFKLEYKENAAATEKQYPIGDPNKDEDDNCKYAVFIHIFIFPFFFIYLRLN